VTSILILGLTIYNFCSCIWLLFETWPLLTADLLIRSYYLNDRLVKLFQHLLLMNIHGNVNPNIAGYTSTDEKFCEFMTHFVPHVACRTHVGKRISIADMRI
jgi:hypothetical protein